jgi:hypothetical protein
MTLRFLGKWLAVASAVVVVGCGGSDEPNAPSQVTAKDLDKNGEFWNSLTPDLKDELAELCKRDLGDQRAEMSGEPTVANRIQAIPTTEVVSYVDKQYTNDSKIQSKIKINCHGALDVQIQQQFDEAIGQLGTEQP